jgi:exopolysaccharide biosynthesis glucuronosyltransferase PssE
VRIVIFVTVGSMVPFDRLVESMDTWAAANPSVPVFAQIGDGKCVPKACRWQRMISPAEFDARCREAEVIVAHAGMGTILTALQFGRPLVIMPRRAELHEHTTDHQIATAERFGVREGITVVNDAQELRKVLDEHKYKAPTEQLSSVASPELIDRLRSFILSPGRRL